MPHPAFPYRLLDLTHSLHPEVPTWTGSCGFRAEVKRDYADRPGDGASFRIQQLKLHAGIGTHLDAPAHFFPEMPSVGDLPLEQLFAPCCVIDFQEPAHAQSSLSVEDVRAFEAKHGRIGRGSFVMVRSGWERFWNQPERYRNGHQFPAVSAQAAELLLERGAVGLGIDTLSPDRPESGFPVHRLFLGAGTYLIENAAHLAQLPPTGAFLLALPLKTVGCVESPLRLVGLVPQ